MKYYVTEHENYWEIYLRSDEFFEYELYGRFYDEGELYQEIEYLEATVM
jgi:hypothetical protein